MQVVARAPLGVGLVAFALVAGCSAPDNTSTTEHPIEEGAVDTVHQAVGMLGADDTYGCTGTLVRPTVVLTSAHCLGRLLTVFQPGRGRANSDDHLDPNERKYEVIDRRAYPEAMGTLNSCPNPNPDVALVRLREPVVDVVPMPISFASPTMGETCSIVGFGVHFDEAGAIVLQERRVADERIEELMSSSIRLNYLTGQANNGDSGGPLVCNGSVVGTSSCSHKDGDRRTKRGEDYYSRVENARDFVTNVLAEWESPQATPCSVLSDRRLHCGNSADAHLHAEAKSSSPVVDHLRTTESWFDCWKTGELHDGGNSIWYRTVGDDNDKQGWIPSAALNTPDSLDADPYGAGLQVCD
jgi:hypothetical protein